MNKQAKKTLHIVSKIDKLQSKISHNQQKQLVKELLLIGIQGQEELLELLINRRINNKIRLSYLDSIIFEFLVNSDYSSISEAIKYYFPNGLVYLKSNLSSNYQSLQNLLIMHRYQEADKLTQQKLCQIAGLNTDNKRDWLYFTDIMGLPSEDLITINSLWQVYSRYKFGFLTQRRIWISNNCDWEKLWHQIGWKNNGVPRRYPEDFLWNVDAPDGHLPLFNQLRGVQVLSALFNHVAWNE